MAFFEMRPFEVGKTYGQTTAPSTGDPSLAYEGLEVYVEDKDPTQALRRSNRIRKLRVVRNSCNSDGAHGGDTITANKGNLLPKRLAKFDSTALYGTRCDGYALLDGANFINEKGYPVDEYITSTGVVPNDLFYIVVQGPAMCTMAFNQVADTNVGDAIHAITGSTTGSTSGGRVGEPTYNVATTVLSHTLMAYLGRAMSAVSSSQTSGTSANILVDIGA